jgi:hypothetical protein
MDVTIPAPSTAIGAGAESPRAANAEAGASPEPVRPPAAFVPGSQPGTSAGPGNGSPEVLGDQSSGANGAAGAVQPSGPIAGRQGDQTGAATGAQATGSGPGIPPGVIVSSGLLIAGLVLFLLRWRARRLVA